PLTFFLRFFLNHGLLDITHRPQWYVIEGGSRAYIEPLTQGFRNNIRLNAPVEWLRRTGQGIELQVHGKIEHFDEVIFACHSDQALALLSDANHLEHELLGAMGY
ncbi:hypothetical protein, partial [Bacillus cereus group sp. Bce013]